MKEEGKPNSFSLGKSLLIGQEVWRILILVISVLLSPNKGPLSLYIYYCPTNYIIFSQEYEDLDEILARYIQPLASNARELISYKYYSEANGGDRLIMEKALKDEKSKNPRRIPYLFSASKQFPGRFLIGYLPSNKVKFEFVSIHPEGFRYRGNLHRSLNQLVNWFKENYRTPIRGTPGHAHPGSVVSGRSGHHGRR